MASQDLTNVDMHRDTRIRRQQLRSQDRRLVIRDTACSTAKFSGCATTVSRISLAHRPITLGGLILFVTAPESVRWGGQGDEELRNPALHPQGLCK